MIPYASGHPSFVYDEMRITLEKVLLDEKWPHRLFKVRNIKTIFKVLCAVDFDIYCEWGHGTLYLEMQLIRLGKRSQATNYKITRTSILPRKIDAIL